MSDDSPPDPSEPADVRDGRLRDVLESISDGFYALDAQWRYVLVNRAAEDYFGVSRDELIGRSMWERFPQGRGTDFERFCRLAMTDGAVTHFETPSKLRPDRVVELRIGPLRGGGLTVTLTDITERRAAEARLQEISERNETLAAQRSAILSQLAEGVIVTDAEGRIVFVNQAAERLHGVARLDVAPDDYSQTYRLFTDDGVLYPPQDLPLTRAVRDGAVVLDASWRIQRPDGGVVRAIGSARPILDDTGKQIGAVLTVRDDTARSLAEEHSKLMVLELNHRVKNNLATVQAIASQTLRGVQTVPEAREALMSRITALAAAHDILTREQWDGVGIAEVASGVLDVLHDGVRGRVQLSGHDVRLTPKAALSLSMAFHELGTNALKYGALSSPQGRVRVHWTVGPAPERRLRLTWTEAGGPEVKAPSTRGFGSRLLERGLAAELRGHVRLEFLPEGLRCEIETPMAVEAAPTQN
ncbi:sensor histidine kinase [Phenylobacterium sp.]|uniref:sensor histidine kinase n=1 Tax=Phenylobacterium sp. TaxID=1871053 RepID=UPI003982EBD9